MQKLDKVAIRKLQSQLSNQHTSALETFPAQKKQYLESVIARRTGKSMAMLHMTCQ